jgi:hypothetical protein
MEENDPSELLLEYLVGEGLGGIRAAQPIRSAGVVHDGGSYGFCESVCVSTRWESLTLALKQRMAVLSSILCTLASDVVVVP